MRKRRNESQTNNEKGITLVALVITITKMRQLRPVLLVSF